MTQRNTYKRLACVAGARVQGTFGNHDGDGEDNIDLKNNNLYTLKSHNYLHPPAKNIKTKFDFNIKMRKSLSWSTFSKIRIIWSWHVRNVPRI